MHEDDKSELRPLRERLCFQTSFGAKLLTKAGLRIQLTVEPTLKWKNLGSIFSCLIYEMFLCVSPS
jgi:hypothetical protein